MKAAAGASAAKTWWFAHCSLITRQKFEEILQKLEIIPMVKAGESEAIDVAAVIRRHPQVALIDGLAYENPPGCQNAYRWQDVEQLLEAGISVVTTVNIQYLEKLQDEVERITGKRASCTIPSGFLDRTADEIVVVDAPGKGRPLARAGNRRRNFDSGCRAQAFPLARIGAAGCGLGGGPAA